MNELVRHVPQDRQISADVVAVRVYSSPEIDGTVDVTNSGEEGGATEPHPGSGVDGPVRIDEELVENFHP